MLTLAIGLSVIGVLTLALYPVYVAVETKDWKVGVLMYGVMGFLFVLGYVVGSLVLSLIG